MRYLRIHSSNPRVSISDIFTLGVSTARGTDKIGQFGSGSMMSALAWMRIFGDSPITFVNGEKVRFSSTPDFTSEGGNFNRVFIHVGRKKRELSVSLEYGEKDWNDSGMALREWISNAIDQKEDVRECVSVAESMEPTTEGVTIYVKLQGEVLKYWRNLSTKFLHVTEMQDEKMIEKSECSNMSHYRRGVLIRTYDKASLYDYNLDFDVAENRNGSSDSMMEDTYRHLAHNATEQQCDKILENALKGKECFETSWDTWLSFYGGNWKKAVEKLPGVYIPNNCLPGVGDDESIRVPPKWYAMIVEKCPEKDGFSTVANKNGFLNVEVTAECRNLFDTIWDCVCAVDIAHGKQKPTLEMFKTADGQMPKCLGCCENGVISIWQDQAASFQTILEEICHHTSGYGDCTRKFQEYLFRMLTEALRALS